MNVLLVVKDQHLIAQIVMFAKKNLIPLTQIQKIVFLNVIIININTWIINIVQEKKNVLR